MSKIFCFIFTVLFLNAHGVEYDIFVLKKHNEYRDKHNVPHLKLDKRLSEECADYAKQCTTQHESEYSTSNGKYSENLCTHKESRGSCEAEWYRESFYYNYERPRISNTTRSFTAMIWKSSTHLGVGVSKTDGETITVVRYRPPGNIYGQFIKNVPPPNKSNKIKVSLLLSLIIWSGATILESFLQDVALVSQSRSTVKKIRKLGAAFLI
ncbi:Golgi-associated plant pathogenesis-related protein 1-like [Scaptodrosophila lebanonensis]|uniref:Golgi-associated plant pathogenesis-related protein 1-like n=1 Tax=Drosophila lebanonensis TaxID=7225 RepID=A0A6J2TE91_DROLE|nr:Golgi-associated plant pathogenesis-related protein 1-like [Scaptodrosophila lebanonensis]